MGELRPLVGSRGAISCPVFGRTLECTYEVCEIKAGRRFAMATAQDPFAMEMTYTGRTRQRYDQDDASQPGRTLRVRRGHSTGDDVSRAEGQRGGFGAWTSSPSVAEAFRGVGGVGGRA